MMTLQYKYFPLLRSYKLYQYNDCVVSLLVFLHSSD